MDDELRIALVRAMGDDGEFYKRTFLLVLDIYCRNCEHAPVPHALDLADGLLQEMVIQTRKRA